jgi:histidine ammonia-lyase
MIELDGRSLGLEDVGRIASGAVPVGIAPAAREEVSRSRTFIEQLLATGERIYGVTTGFGRLAEVVISPDQQRALQKNLVRSHASGVGQPLLPSQVRAVMALRANALARGNSGCRLVVLDRILEYLNRGITPVVPMAGSVGASGDLAPLAHVALALVGEGRVWHDGSERDTATVLAREGLEPLDLVEKEGLSLINGTQATTGLGILALLAAERALESAEVAGAMSLEGLRGTPEAFRPEVHRARPHPGQTRTAARLRALLESSEIRESHRHGDPRVQDAYCLRCMPQVHGAGRDALAHVRGVLEIEANSATDNPLVFPEAGAVVSAGNFHGQVVAQALDFLCIAVTDLAAISERRLERLLNPDLSGHPAFLAREPGLESGFMISQVTAVDLLAEMRVLAHPASVDSVPTSANQEDHVSMGMAAARKATRSVECLEYVLAVELMVGAQALDYLEPLRPGRGVERAHRLIREHVAPLDGDRSFSNDIEAVRDLIRTGRVAECIPQLSES